ncbi:protein BUNDLE SHEATH DEFECTIVE 2, chloroplastic [Jatropha curcas]|uniref:protein BUNDLE SHEATH DEFECTIVE 2, chloroplastic n=1 Tax=Jatropha curcas TaxID=180498 RepID=UPI0005FB1D22|nr:protein BUNDLE SHEATH DEFECTIVE 2, chloroplastic [Jatropha curcas]
MVNTLCFTPVCSLVSPNKPGVILGDSVAGKVLRVGKIFQSSKSSKFQSLEAKAAGGNKGTKPNSIVCADCDGNGAKICSQCKGTGVNSVDHFNGQFKAGGLCWLCRGKRDILCGSCNGAGFLGGFMSTFDD